MIGGLRSQNAFADDKDAAKSTELLIVHALDMALDGSNMQLTIRQTGVPAGPGIGAPGIPPAGAPGAPGAAPPPGAPGAQPGAMPGQGGVMQLQQETRRAFQGSYDLIKESNKLLRSSSESRGERSSASRLYAAANLYSNSLYSLARETFGWEAGWEPTDRSREGEQPGQPAPGQPAPGQPAPGQLPVGQPRLGAMSRISPTDIAAITALNHAVKEAIDAFELSQAMRGQGDDGDGSKRLREHVRAMSESSRKTVDQILASARERAPGAPGAAPGAPGAAPGAPGAAPGAAPPPGADRPIGGAGWSGTEMQALAQQAREVVRVLDELGSNGGSRSGSR
jgi:hypothetical protein